MWIRAGFREVARYGLRATIVGEASHPGPDTRAMGAAEFQAHLLMQQSTARRTLDEASPADTTGESMGSVTVAEPKRRIDHVQEKLVVDEQDTMISILAVLGPTPSLPGETNRQP